VIKRFEMHGPGDAFGNQRGWEKGDVKNVLLEKEEQKRTAVQKEHD